VNLCGGSGNRVPSLQMRTSLSQVVMATLASLLLHKVWWCLNALILVKVVMEEVSLHKERRAQEKRESY